MPNSTTTQLKEFFELNDFPTQGQFAKLIDATANENLTGDVSVDNNNVVTITKPGESILEKTIELTSLDILGLGGSTSTGIIAINSPGVNKYIEVIKVVSQFTYISPVYSGSPAKLALTFSDSSYPIFDDGGAIKSGLSLITNWGNTTGNPISQSIIIQNTDLFLNFFGSQVTNGNGTLKINILYRIITL